MLNSIKMTGVAVAATLCLFAHATDYYLTEDATDWSEKSSYTLEGGSTPEELPGPEDTVFLPEGKSCSFVGGSDSFNTFANVKLVRLAGGNVIAVEVAENVTNELNCAISAGSESLKLDNAVKGTLRKLGLGTLELKSKACIYAKSSGQDLSYFCQIAADAGDLLLQQNPDGDLVYFGALTVAAGARVFVVPTLDTTYLANGFTFYGGIHGAGEIRNDYDGTSVVKSYRDAYASVEIQDVPFSGAIHGKVRLYAAGLELAGTASTFSDNAYASYSDDYSKTDARPYALRFAKIGKKGEPSPLGSGGFGTGQYGGYLLYTGTEGEETDKAMTFNACYNKGLPPPCFDAGNYGGLHFTGAWSGNSTFSSGRGQLCLVIAGENTEHACVIDAKVNRLKYSSSYYPIHLVKRGCGIWELSGKAKNSENTGAITVENGTLRFDSLAEAGTACSLGSATELYEAKTGSLGDLTAIPYAIVLGTTNTAGRLEYVGTDGFKNTTRLIGLAGTGVLASTGGDVAFTGVTSAGAGNRTLVLDGDRVGGMDTVSNVTNGEGVVSVVKTGAGSWFLDGELSFAGDLIVSNGTLTVESSDAPYKWFRLTVKGTSGKTDESGYVACVPRLYEFALYDRNGVRQNVGLTCNRTTTYTTTRATSTYLEDPAEIAPGAFTIGKIKTFWQCQASGADGIDRDVTALFSDTGSSGSKYSQGWCWTINTNTGFVKCPQVGDDTTWTHITMRLTNSTPEIAAYDFTGYPGASRENIVTDWAISGSRNGTDWTVLTNVAWSAEERDAMQSGYWYSDPKKLWRAGAVRPGEGFALKGSPDGSALALASNVYVAPGATLKAEGTVVVSRLTLDPVGMGTLDGFTFAESGVLNAGGEQPAGRPVELPYAFTNAKGVDNLENWSVSVNGKIRRGWTITRKDDKFVLTPPGVMLIVR